MIGISEVKQTLSLMINMGFKFDSGQIQIFDREFRLLESLVTQNTEPIIIQTNKRATLLDGEQKKVRNCIEALLSDAGTWHTGLPIFFSDEISIKTFKTNFHLVLELEDQHYCLIVFSYFEKVYHPDKKELDYFTSMLQLGLNSHLKNQFLKQRGILIGELKMENTLKDFLLFFFEKIARSRSLGEFQEIIQTQLRNTPFQTTLLFEFSEPINISYKSKKLASQADSVFYQASEAHSDVPLSLLSSPPPEIKSNANRCYFIECTAQQDITNLIADLNLVLLIRKIDYLSFEVKGSDFFGKLWVYKGLISNIKAEELRFYTAICLGIANSIETICIQEKKSAEVAELEKYKQRLKVENNYLTAEIKHDNWLEGLDNYGEKMQHIGQLIKKVASSNTTVLIQGETGTGKELVARAIHAASNRKYNVIVKLNCAALPVTLIESELFGHEKGSFTGATERHIGKFESAENGTLLLDEVGEMPLEVQSKVLRAIQEREIERIGGKGIIKINVRIIAATNRDLQKEVSEGRFRSDLFYRLNVFPIQVPRLKDRKEDIIKLVEQFIKKFSFTKGFNTYSISDKCLGQMLRYDWPGNVRELEHMIERSILLSKGNVIKHIDLSLLDRRLDSSRTKDLKTLDENEREHILCALNKTKGKIFGKEGAAELLGIHYSTLNSRMKKLGIQKFVITST